LVKKLTKKEISALKKPKNPFDVDQVEMLEDEISQLEEEINLEKEAEKLVGEGDENFDPDFWADVILTFGCMMSNTKLFEYQEEAALALIKSLLTLDIRARDEEATNDRITVHFPRQSGKTEIFKVVVPACAVILPELAKKYPTDLDAYKNGMYVGVFALSSETSSTMFNRLQEVFRAGHSQPFLEDPQLNVKVRRTNPITLSNGSLIRAHTLMAKILVSYSYHLMIVDEADKALDTHRLITDVQPMGTAYNGTFVMLGTAGDSPCLFYNYIEANKEAEKEGKPKKHFQIHWKEAQRVNQRYKASMRGVLQDLEAGIITIKSFKMSYELEWLIDDNRFISKTAFNEMLDNKAILYNDSTSEFIKGATLVAGLDLAKKVDRTVLTILKLKQIEGSNRYMKQIVSWVELQKIKYPQQRRILFEYLTRFRIETMFADGTGNGDVFCDNLMEDLADFYIEIVPFVFSDKSKSEGYAKLEDAIERREFIIPGDYEVKQTDMYKHFYADCRNSQKVHKKNYTLVEAKPPAHDDYVDSLMLANLAAEDYIEYGDFSMVEDAWGYSGGNEWVSV